MTIPPTFTCEPPEPGSLPDLIQERVERSVRMAAMMVENMLRDMLRDGQLRDGWSLAQSLGIDDLAIVKIPPSQGLPAPGSWRVWGPYTPDQVQRLHEALAKEESNG